MRAKIVKFFFAATVTVGVGTALAVNLSEPQLEAQILREVSDAADFSGMSGVKFGVSGRDVSLSGLTTNPRAFRKFVAKVQHLPAVRDVADSVSLAPHASPYPLVIRREGAKLFLSGGVPDLQIRQELADATGADVAGLTLLSGYPPLGAWKSTLERGLELADRLSQGEVRLENLDIVVDGFARTLKDYDRLRDLGGQPTQEGLGSLKVAVAPPLQSPYFWNARFDGANVTFSGFAPSAEAVDVIRTALPSRVAVKALVRPASGAPEGFVRHARALVGAFPLVEYGDAHITNAAMRFHGAPTSPENAQLLSARLSDLKATWTFEPPRVARFWLEGEKQGGETRLTGFVSSPETVSRYASLGRVNVRGLLSARGAPTGFADSADLAVATASHLAEGHFRLTDKLLMVAGRAATTADYQMLLELPNKALKRGVRVDVAQITPPIASPYTFSIEKGEDGTVTLKGHVPTSDAQKRFLGEAGPKAIDVTDIAAGAPEGFLSQAQTAVALMGTLASGKAQFDGERWSLSGVALDDEKGRHALEIAQQNELESKGWTLDVQMPAPSIATADPYVWNVKKAEDGTWQISGSSPSESLKKFFEVHVGQTIKDTTQPAAGEPADFIGNALKTLNALAFLQSGEGGFDGRSWTLRGQPETRGDAVAALEVVSSGDAGARGWSIALQSPLVAAATAEAKTSSDAAQPVETATPVATSEPAASANAAAEPTATAPAEAGATSAETAPNTASQTTPPTRGEPASEGGAPGEGEPPTSEALAANAPLSPAETEQTETTQETEPAQETASMADAPSTTAEDMGGQSAEVQTTLPPQATTGNAGSTDVPAAKSETETGAATEVEKASGAEEPTHAVAADSAPEQKPQANPDYAFLAFKARDKAIALSGNVPSDAARAYIESLVGNAPTDTVTILPDAPADFMDKAVSGLRALGAMEYGELSLKEGLWSLSGRASSEQAAQNLRTMLAGLPGGAGFKVEIKGPPPIEICQAKINAFDERNAILFNPGSDRLTNSSIAAVDELAAYLQLCPKASVEVEGHTDSDGDAASNLALSVARAEAVVDALVARGVQEARLYAIGYGESLPVASNDTVAGKQANRRIVVKVSEKGL